MLRTVIDFLDSNGALSPPDDCFRALSVRLLVERSSLNRRKSKIKASGRRKSDDRIVPAITFLIGPDLLVILIGGRLMVLIQPDQDSFDACMGSFESPRSKISIHNSQSEMGIFGTGDRVDRF
jgi:hypothetical protein